MLKEEILKDSIATFASLEECLVEIERMYKRIESSVDIASLDYINRTNKNAMDSLKSQFTTNEKVKYRYLFYPAVERLESVLSSITDSNTLGKNNYYAHINESVRLPFASFIILDDKYFMVRSPYEEGEKSHYLLISNELLCAMFVKWFSMMWKEAKLIDNKDDLEYYIAKIKESKV